MKPNPRICRAIARQVAPPPPLTTRQEEREDRILAVGQVLMAQFGRNNVTFSMLAVALQITTATLRFHYVDLDALLAQILWDHMETIEERLLEVPPTAPNYRQALRAAYRATSHDENGKIRPAHLLLQRDSRLLPEDERKPILKARQNLATRLKAPAPTRAAAKIPATPQPRPTPGIAPAIAPALAPAIAHSFSPARTLTPGQAPGLPIATPAEMARMVAEMDAQFKRQKNARAELHLGGARPTPTNFMNASG